MITIEGISALALTLIGIVAGIYIYIFLTLYMEARRRKKDKNGVLAIERKPAYDKGKLVACANYEIGTGKYKGDQRLCRECIRPSCPFKAPEQDIMGCKDGCPHYGGLDNSDIVPVPICNRGDETCPAVDSVPYRCFHCNKPKGYAEICDCQKEQGMSVGEEELYEFHERVFDEQDGGI